MRKNNGKLTELMTLLVFAVFALCIMWLLLTGAGVYQRLTKAAEDSFQARVTGQYLATRVRQAQTVSLEEFAGTRALALGENIAGEEYVTWVYVHEGYLRELFAARQAEKDPEDGEKLLPVPVLELSLEGQLLTIRTETGSQILYIQTGREVPK